jgi:hypothetical protein
MEEKKRWKIGDASPSCSKMLTAGIHLVIGGCKSGHVKSMSLAVQAKIVDQPQMARSLRMRQGRRLRDRGHESLMQTLGGLLREPDSLDGK